MTTLKISVASTIFFTILSISTAFGANTTVTFDAWPLSDTALVNYYSRDGFTWNSFGYMYGYGVGGSKELAFNKLTGPSDFDHKVTWDGAGTFNFVSVDMMYYDSSATVTFSGYNNGSLLYGPTNKTTTGSFQTFTFNWTGVDEIRMTPGGEHDFDNFVYNTSSCTEPYVPMVTFTPTSVCPGDSTTLNISGNLNDATAWHIYEGSCGGGTIVGNTSGSSFVVTPPGTTTTYMIRGEGGCATPGSCGSTTVTASDIAVPTITCPGNQTGNANGSGQFTLPNYTGLAATSDNCTASPSVTQTPVPGSTISATTVVTLTSTDGSLNTANCAFNVSLNAPPSLSSFTRQTPATSPTNADTLVFQAIFNEDVQNVDVNDFSVNGTTTATITGISVVTPGTVYDITVSGGDLAGFNGTVGLNLAVGQNITDTLGNALLAGEPATDETYTVDNSVDLSVTKNDGVTSAVPGQSTLVYTIVASNSGPNDDPSAILTDTFPAVLTCTYTSVAAGSATGNTAAGSGNLSEELSLPVGSSVTYTASCTIDSSATGTLSNTASIVGSISDSAPGNNSATDNNTVMTPQADLSITKTDGVTSAVPGQSVTYTIVASNSGPSADPAASLTDTFPADLTCTYTSVAAGGATGNTNSAGNLSETLSMPSGSSVTYAVSCSIDPAATGTLSNTASIAASVTDPAPGNSSATDGDTVLTAEADLSITKTDGVTSAVPGQSVTYTIVASNSGPSADPAASLTDTFPADLTCTYTSVAAGGATGNTNSAGNLSETLSMPSGSSVTYAVSCSIDPAATGTLSNTASIVASVTDPAPGNSSATDGDTVLTAEADLSITKTDGVTSAVPGQSVIYTIVASNSGPSADPAASLIDTFPADLSCTYTSMAAGGATGNTNSAGNLSDTLSLPSGSSVTYTVSCGIDSAATGTLSNTASIAASATDPAPGNNSATDGDTVLTAEADLSITKTDGVTSAVPGQSVIYTIVASNSGPSADPAASLIDTFPADLSCTYTSMAAGGATGNTNSPGNLSDTLSLPSGSSVTYTVSCGIDSAATGTLSNTASIAASATDPAPGNNSATDGDTVLTPEADLAVTKTDGVTSAKRGDTVTYTIVASNIGPSDATGVSVTDTFPAGVTSCSWTSAAGGGATGNNTPDLGDISEMLAMPAGSFVTYTADCTVDSAATGTIANTVTISGSATDPIPGNNSATDSYTVTYDYDFGDAPDPTYPTLLASSGASHVLGSSVYLGSAVDADTDGQPNATATGDNDDGVTFTTVLGRGATAGIDVAANAACTLSAWVDFNQDGDWADVGEDIFPGGQALAAGVNSLNYSVPAAATDGATIARFRCTTDGAVPFTGIASDGEVEDYQVSITTPSYLLTVSKSGAGAGAVTTDVGVIDCGSTCSDNYLLDTVVTLSVTLDAISTFNSWSGGGCSGTGDCVVTLTGDTTVIATFDYTDDDSDNIPDFWEESNACLGSGDNSSTDSDFDTILDPDEYIAGTNPCSPDSDGDGLSDTLEVSSIRYVPTTDNGTLLDSDSDGLPDVYETTVGLDPFVANIQTSDYDGDGLSDRHEYLLGLDPTVDDQPLTDDSNGDGIPDAIAAMTGLITFDACADPDGDGIANNIELANGTSPVIDNALLTDSDGDGVPDLVEWLAGSDNLFAYENGSLVASPLGNDLDGDSLIASTEICLGTLADNPDSDGDGSDDAIDIFPNDITKVCTGDVNMNGTVEVVDAMLVLQMSVGLVPDNLLYGDVAPMLGGLPNPDTQINAADAMLILRKALGLVNW